MLNSPMNITRFCPDSSRMPAAAEAKQTPLRMLCPVAKGSAYAGRSGSPNNSPAKS